MIRNTGRTITLTGASGMNYLFNLLAFDDFNDLRGYFDEIPGLYAFGVLGDNGFFTYVYFGKAESLSNRFYVHHKENSIRAYQANCIGICCLNEFRNSEILEKSEKDVLSAIKFPCNEVNN